MEVLRAFAGEHGVRFSENFPLSRISRVGTKGAALFYFGILSEEGFLKVMSALVREGVPYRISGCGFNTLWGDAFFRGAVVDMSLLKGLSVKDGVLVASAGCSLSALVRFCVDSGLSGFEELAGIPGSVGASVVGNAGAFGRALGDLVEWVKVWIPHEGRCSVLKREEVAFSYRDSSLRGFVVLSAAFSFSFSDKQKVRQRVKEVLAERKRRFPAGRSLGSVFKNPDGDFAGKILDELGFKGLSLGKVRVSEKHANFILSEKDAVASDYLSLINKIKREVSLRRGIHLEEEIDYAGAFV